jgi:hypothetical protein
MAQPHVLKGFGERGWFWVLGLATLFTGLTLPDRVYSAREAEGRSTLETAQPPMDLPEWIRNPKPIDRPYFLANVVPPLVDEDDPRSETADQPAVPVADTVFSEHVRKELSEEEQVRARELLTARKEERSSARTESSGDESGETGGLSWGASKEGLLFRIDGSAPWERYEKYGVDGPLSTVINGLAVDSKGNLWVATPLGLSVREASGEWRHIRGREGLPVENVTALDIDGQDRIWLGTHRGAVLYLPYSSGRQWFYRAGGRYLKDDRIKGVAIAAEGWPVYFESEAGISSIDEMRHTLREKADWLEERVNRFHRRLGLVVESVLDSPLDPSFAYTLDDANDGLWTSWHVTALSLAYAVTGKEEHRESAKESMHAIIRLQNNTGVPGLPARTLVANQVGSARREAAKNARSHHRREEWRPSPSGEYYWRSDTSNDEIDGHFLALYSYWRHIAQHDPAELELIRTQTRALADHIIGNNYHLHDWDGEPTTWGTWSPEDLNDGPTHYLENGLNSLQLLSFLKTAYAITGDPKYQEHYENLIVDHHYLSNLLLEKKVFPDMHNHSDDQLGYVAWYPLLQLEWDPKIRQSLHQAVRRHYKIIESEKGSFFFYVSGTVDPGYVDFVTAAENLREIPRDRRMWRVTNSDRADVNFRARDNRFGRPVLDTVLPADERSWNKWNGDPYLPDGGGPGGTSPSGVTREGVEIPRTLEYPDGAHEDDGASWLMAYWMGRYHGFITDPVARE